MIKILPLILAALAFFVLLQYYRQLPKERKRPFAIKAAVYAVIAILIIAVLTGRIHWLGAVAAGVLGVLKFGLGTLLRFGPVLRVLGKNKSMRNPVFTTAHIKVEFHLNDGSFSGEIISGTFAGKAIQELSEDEINTLLNEYKNSNKRSHYLLLIASKRVSDTRFDETSANASSNDMQIEEARMTLGLDTHFDIEAVEKAHKRLIQKLHPDRGGNDYLAARVNQARDTLLAHLKR